MTPAEEDALIKECCPFEGFAPKWADIRLAIRAAVAQERERAAIVAENDARSHPDDAARIAAAQEARERAEARVKSLVLDLSAAIGRYQRAEERAAACENDAQRYRWLRNPTLPVAIWINNELPFAVDTVIDAAIAARAK